MADQIQEIVARLRLLATTAGPENVAQTLRLVAATAAGRRTLDRYVASMLASCHPVEALAVAFAGWQRERRCLQELRACLVHELVLRGSSSSRREWRTGQLRRTGSTTRWAGCP